MQMMMILQMPTQPFMMLKQCLPVAERYIISCSWMHSIDFTHQNKKRQFLVKWKGYAMDQAGWVSEEDVNELVLRYIKVQG